MRKIKKNKENRKNRKFEKELEVDNTMKRKGEETMKQ